MKWSLLCVNKQLEYGLYCILLKLKLIYNRQSVGQSILLSGSDLKRMTRFLFSV
jgi:hypothetical protein